MQSTLSNLERNECNLMGGAGGCGPGVFEIGNSLAFQCGNVCFLMAFVCVLVLKQVTFGDGAYSRQCL